MKIQKILNLFILFTIILLSCETHPPTVTDFGKVEVKLAVLSNVEGALIYLDDVFTEKFTPDTIKTDIGSHTITLVKEGFLSNSVIVNVDNEIKQNIYIELTESNVSKIVLLEDFANVSCDPCVISNNIIRNLNKKYGDQIAVIKFSTNFPSPTDPFYLSNKSINDSRMSYYNILFAPTIIIDGISRPIPTDSSEIIDVIENRLLENSPFKIEIYDERISDSCYIQTNVTLLDKSFNYKNYNLFVMIVEEEKSFPSPPGSNGETVFYHIMREILPNNGGLSLSFNDDSLIIKRDFELGLKDEWNSDLISSIVIIQDVATREVYQVSETSK